VCIYTNSFTYNDCILLAISISAIGVDTKVVFDRVGKNGINQYILKIDGFFIKKKNKKYKCIYATCNCSTIYAWINNVPCRFIN
jgi:hypothetical protein